MLIVAYRARSIGGTLRAGDDASDVRLFAAQQLPPQASPVDGSATDRWLYGVIQEATAGWRPA